MLKSRPLKSLNDRRALKAARRSADEQLLASKLASPRLAWRSAELLAPEHRIDVGRSLTDTVHAADERLLPSASPLDRAAVRECRAQLLDLAAYLFDLDRSVTPRGMLLVERLLSDSRGPLYGNGETRRLRIELHNVREALTT
ncbi:MAG TPA: hypothetical protein VJP39_04795 [Gaiellaceae bacterium]|nr:hypothetical protein [Gaiellaceae bacterium]